MEQVPLVQEEAAVEAVAEESVTAVPAVVAEGLTLERLSLVPVRLRQHRRVISASEAETLRLQLENSSKD
jgi:hypothetical protein